VSGVHSPPRSLTPTHYSIPPLQNEAVTGPYLYILYKCLIVICKYRLSDLAAFGNGVENCRCCSEISAAALPPVALHRPSPALLLAEKSLQRSCFDTGSLAESKCAPIHASAPQSGEMSPKRLALNPPVTSNCPS
jgi:hypothetical protein